MIPLSFTFNVYLFFFLYFYGFFTIETGVSRAIPAPTSEALDLSLKRVPLGRRAPG